jgi:hypothetical protein
LPTELLELIVANIHDKPALEACSLASSVLRKSSQAVLLNRLSLCTHPVFLDFHHFSAAEERFSALPHLAGLVTELVVQLPGSASRWKSVQDAAESVFCRLTRVRKAYFQQSFSDADVQTERSPAPFDWILHTRIRTNGLIELALFNVTLRPASFPTLFAAVRSLDLSDVHVDSSG